VTGTSRLSTAALPQTRAALAYAKHLHAGQRRKVDGAPFIVHPTEVGLLLQDAGAPDHVIAAGVLHDTIEKCGADVSELRERFGADTAMLVVAVSEDSHIRGHEARKAALRRQVASAGDEAMTVFAADKISKARELSLKRVGTLWQNGSRPASVERQRKLTHYQRSLEMLEAWRADSPLVIELRTELEQWVHVPGGRHLAGAA
jgi:hypothetical protein